MNIILKLFITGILAYILWLFAYYNLMFFYI